MRPAPRPRSGAPTDSVDGLLRELAPKVRAWVFRHLGPGPHLDDATQEALIAIADALPRFEGRSKLTTYARRIAIRAAQRHRRKNPPGQALEAVHDVDGLTPEKLAMQRESIRRLYAALDTLSPKLRSVYILCDVEKTAHEEAAAIAEVSVNTLRARLKRARLALRSQLIADPYFAGLFTEGT